MLKMIRSVIVSIGIVIFPVCAYAQTPDCAKAETQADLNICAGLAFEKADHDLNAAYKRLKEKLDTAVAEKLTASQRAWVSFRDAECALVATSTEGGSIQPMIVAECLERLTTDRTDQLNAHMNCEEGDVSCLVPGP